jgi:HEAT repeat protein
MPDMSLTERLAKVGASLTEDETAVARRHIEKLRAAGIESFKDLLAAVTEVKTPASLRAIGCRLLAWLGDADAGAALECVLADAGDEGLLWEAARALAWLHASQATPTLLGLLNHGRPAEQSAAAWVLGWLGAAAAIPSLCAAARKTILPTDVRAHATEALGVMRAQEAVRDLIPLLSDESPELRFWAAYALGEIGDPHSIPALKRIAADDTSVLPHGRSVRQEALDALNSIRGKERGS